MKLALLCILLLVCISGLAVSIAALIILPRKKPKNTIPPRVWLCGPFKKNEIPPQIQAAMDSWKSHPGVAQKYFSHEDAEKFIATHYPQYLKDYQDLVPGAFRADLWRLLVLLKHGGVYVDCGCRLLEPDLWKSILQVSLMFSDDSVGAVAPGAIHQGIIGAVANHPAIAAAIQVVVGNIRARFYGRKALDVTGPTAVGPPMAKALDTELVKLATGGVAPRGRLQLAPWIPGMYGDDLLVLKHDHVNSQISHGAGVVVVRTKFPGYYDIMYKLRKTTDYPTLWRQRKIYAS